MQYLKLYKYFNYNKKTQNIIIQMCIRDSNVFAKLASGRLVSNSTEYTTANEVVESAIPAIKAACVFHPAIKQVNRDTPIKGTRNDKNPIKKLSLYFSLIT